MRLSLALAAAALALPAAPAFATLLPVTNCGGAALSCIITASPPATVTRDPNDNILTLWNEQQNVVLTADLAVDRVFDPGASFVGGTAGNYFLRAGTIVSSHYVQWDPDAPLAAPQTATATINADSQIFAFIYADQKLFDSDALLGRTGVNYNNFTNRGLEAADSTAFNGSSVDISWAASTPGDWARLITAYSPAAAEVPVPAAAPLLAGGLAALGLLGRRRKG